MKARDQLITFNVHHLALPLVKKFVQPCLVPLSMKELSELPEGSLGNELFHFLMRNNFSLLPHFETHDVKHVLLNYGISGKEEACMQFFYLGNRHYSAASVVSAIASFILMPECFFSFRKAFQRGRKAQPIGKICLGDLLHCQVNDLQKRFHIEFLPEKNKN